MELLIQQALAKIVPQQRHAFLEQLMGRFPGEHDVQSPADQDARATGAANDPVALVEMLITSCSAASADTRRKVLTRLQAAGFVTERTGGTTAAPGDENLRDLRTRLGLPADQPLDPARLNVLLVQLVTLADNLDEMTWGIWKLIAPNNAYGKVGGLSESMARYLREGGSVAADALSRDRERLGRLSGLLLHSYRRLARPLFDKVMGPLKPAIVWESTGGKDMPMMPSKSAACWRELSTRLNAIDAQRLQTDLFSLIEQFVSDALGNAGPARNRGEASQP